LFVINIAEIYPEKLQNPMRHTSALFHISGITSGIPEGSRELFGHIGIYGYYTDGKPDIFYTRERKYQEIPKANYYIFEYIYDTIIDAENRLVNVKIIRNIRVFDNNELLDDLENIPYTSPRLLIMNIIEHNLFFFGTVLSYIRIDVMYHGYAKDSFYTKVFNYKHLPIFEYYTFDYVYDKIFDSSLKSESSGIFEDSLEAYGINDDWVNVKVITDISKAAWPAMW
jgi:hypothetical protein